jgi:hypothetical protein
VVENLESKKAYAFRVWASNSLGPGPPSHPVSYTTPAKPRRPPLPAQPTPQVLGINGRGRGGHARGGGVTGKIQDGNWGASVPTAAESALPHALPLERQPEVVGKAARACRFGAGCRTQGGGAGCPFAHAAANAPAAAAAPNVARAPPPPQASHNGGGGDGSSIYVAAPPHVQAAAAAGSLKICKFGATCRALWCKYAHPTQNAIAAQAEAKNGAPAELAETTAAATAAAGDGSKGSKGSIKLCKFGAACRTVACRFAHPAAQLCASSGADVPPSDLDKGQPSVRVSGKSRGSDITSSAPSSTAPPAPAEAAATVEGISLSCAQFWHRLRSALKYHLHSALEYPCALFPWISIALSVC